MAELHLQRFCATESDTRAYMRAPFRRGDFVYATNGYLVVRVPACATPDAGSLPDDQLPRMPAMFDCIDKAPRFSWVELPAVINAARCGRCRGAARLRVHACESCDGQGSFDRDGFQYDCKACDGEGFHENGDGAKSVDCPRCCGLGFDRAQWQDLDPGDGLPKVRVNAGYLAWLATLPSVVMAPQDPGGLVRFQFDGGHALLLPVRS